MEFQDKTMVCSECGAEFIFTAGEQEFYATRGFTNEPRRCKTCRDARKQQNNANGPRELYEVVCANCGVTTQVPFKPREDRPVYCRDCFQASKK
ncbi:MAG TPA: zinc-binding protein [Firmicutes bacterium]|jgi:CxxC-x17-CxxC domain-containing protein|nr:zinc-binding protein [Bacillota bacterium]